MDYGNLFSRAWTIIWDHKYLMVLGILAALLIAVYGPEHLACRSRVTGFAPGRRVSRPRNVFRHTGSTKATKRHENRRILFMTLRVLRGSNSNLFP